ncbi:MAG: DUF1232 domain-containing protein [Dermatophilaceae bacterium]|nr:DUF1232 domain-containing protein [Dermatophilaceae bacterium]
MNGWTTWVGVALGLAVVWAALLLTLWRLAPDELTAKEALRLLPDTVRMLKRIATDRQVPRGARVRLWLLLAYLALPVDLVPDFLPVIGYADDAVIMILALRSVVRRTGQDTLNRHWPGSRQGLQALLSLTGIPGATREP